MDHAEAIIFDRLLVDRSKCDSCAHSHGSLLVEEGDGQRNRRLLAFSFRFLNRLSEKRALCAQECAPHGCARTTSQPTTQNTRVVALNCKGDGLDARRLHRFAIERFRVSIVVTYTCRTRGEVAERLKAAVC
jgi:hypothetical protein